MRHRTGLLLGAGASVEAGMPLAWDLTNEIKNWLTPDKLRQLNNGWRLQGGGYSETVIEDLVTELERSGMHYEAILGYLETQFRRQQTTAQEYHSLYSWIVDLVSSLLTCRQVNNDLFFERNLPLYDGLNAFVQGDDPLWVFSLNHDLIIEAMAARLRIPLYCGFSPQTACLPRRDARGRKIGEIKAEVINQHDLDHVGMYFPNPLKPGLYLLKVHGSLDTFTFNDGRDVLRLLPEEPGSAGVFNVLRAANNDLFYPDPGAPDGRLKVVNEIAYADDAGEMQFLRRSLLAGAYKFDARASQTLPKSLLKYFQQNVNFVSELICIGYSFGDSHINLVIRNWLEFSVSRHLIIVRPGVAEVPRDFLHVARQVSLINSGCTDYLDIRAGIERSETEKLEKKIGSISRVLGVSRSQEAMSSFFVADMVRRREIIQTKLKTLPMKNGKPDFSELGDPAVMANKWAEEIGESRNETLIRILDHLTKASEGKA
ncbi:MAG: hypothetical protein ACK4FJ_01295 [Ferrovibrio sp.]|uniref:hypothetical protein n=1 Tax=Ferrovibrio sp. TaxID=1917215 RepID=UPI00391B0117